MSVLARSCSSKSTVASRCASCHGLASSTPVLNSRHSHMSEDARSQALQAFYATISLLQATSALTHFIFSRTRSLFLLILSPVCASGFPFEYCLHHRYEHRPASACTLYWLQHGWRLKRKCRHSRTPDLYARTCRACKCGDDAQIGPCLPPAIVPCKHHRLPLEPHFHLQYGSPMSLFMSVVRLRPLEPISRALAVSSSPSLRPLRPVSS